MPDPRMSAVRRVRKARDKCGCETLREFFLLAKQVKKIPPEFDIGKGIKKLRSLDVPEQILSFAEEVHNGALPNLWRAERSSGRVTA